MLLNILNRVLPWWATGDGNRVTVFPKRKCDNVKVGDARYARPEEGGARRGGACQSRVV
jgi:hypothetical protein